VCGCVGGREAVRGLASVRGHCSFTAQQLLAPAHKEQGQGGGGGCCTASMVCDKGFNERQCRVVQ
jgi:hypothetical protein